MPHAPHRSGAQECIQTDYSGASGTAACSAAGNNGTAPPSGPCPSSGVVGCCLLTASAGTAATCYYAAADATSAQSACTGSPEPGATYSWQTTVP